MPVYNQGVNASFEIRRDIKLIREMYSLTQQEMARIIGTSLKTVQRIEAGEGFELNEASRERFYSYVFRRVENFNNLKALIRGEALNEGEILLFHGSKAGIEGEVRADFGSDFNDFGKAFYAGEKYEQSASFVCESPKSSIYLFSLNQRNLRFRKYDVDQDWLLLVGYHRGMLSLYLDHPLLKKTIEESEGFDFLIAPIADNRMFSIIDSFLIGETTDEQCIHCLAATSLGDQYVLKSKRACDRLTMIERLYVCSEEREKYRNVRLKEKENSEAKVRLARVEYKGKGRYIEEILCKEH